MRDAKEALEDIVSFNTKFPTIVEMCEVTRVNYVTLTCEARSLNTDNYYSSVRLTASKDDNGEGVRQGIITIPVIGSNIFVVKMDQFDNYIGFVSAAQELFIQGGDLIISNEKSDGTNYPALDEDNNIIESAPLSLFVMSDNAEFLVSHDQVTMNYHFTRDRDRTDDPDVFAEDTIDAQIQVSEDLATISANNQAVYIDVTKDNINIVKEDTWISLSDDGIQMVKDGVDMKTAMQDLKAAILALTVATPSGPSSTPNNSAQISAAFDDIIEILN